MAEIKMDVSEYEAMKENKALLEKALKEKDDLYAEIKKLNQEKIDALLEAKMKVVRVVRNEFAEHKLVIKSPEEIMVDLNRMFRGEFGDYHNAVRYLSDIFFDRKPATSKSSTEEVTTQGLDDIKAELRKEIEADISEDVRDKLKDYATQGRAILQLQEDNRSLKEDKKTIDSIIYDLNQKLKTATDVSEVRSEALKVTNKIIDDIETLASVPAPFFGRAAVLKKISQICRERFA